MGVVYSQTGVLAKGRAMSSAGEIEELGRELGLAGASLPPKALTFDFDFCLSTSTRFDSKHIWSCLASRRSVSGWGLL